MGKKNRRKTRRGRYDPSAMTHRVPGGFRRIPTPHKAIDPSLAWFVVRAAIGKEKRAAWGLEHAGFDMFFPVCIEERIRRGKRIEVTKGLLSRYLFVGLDRRTLRFDLVREVDGVEAILAVSGAPAAVRTAILQALADRVTGEEAEGMMPDLPIIQAGAQVRVIEGPFAMFNAVVEEVALGRAKVIVDLLGRKTPVELEVGQLEAA